MKYLFTLSTDSTCDLYHDFVTENDIKFVPLTFTMEKDGRMDSRLDNFTEYGQYVDFYNELRAGGFSRTSMLNYESHYEHFLALAKEGAEDVVHFTISSGLSPTKEVAAKAAADVRKDYPKFNVFVVDPLTATAGQGALVTMALRCRNEGKTAQETYDYVNGLRLHLQHFIVANDLNYLKRGGRVSGMSAAVGKHVDGQDVPMPRWLGILSCTLSPCGPSESVTASMPISSHSAVCQNAEPVSSPANFSMGRSCIFCLSSMISPIKLSRGIIPLFYVVCNVLPHELMKYAQKSPPASAPPGRAGRTADACRVFLRFNP